MQIRVRLERINSRNVRVVLLGLLIDISPLKSTKPSARWAYPAAPSVTLPRPLPEPGLLGLCPAWRANSCLGSKGGTKGGCPRTVCWCFYRILIGLYIYIIMYIYIYLSLSLSIAFLYILYMYLLCNIMYVFIVVFLPEVGGIAQNWQCWWEMSCAFGTHLWKSTHEDGKGSEIAGG